MAMEGKYRLVDPTSVNPSLFKVSLPFFRQRPYFYHWCSQSKIYIFFMIHVFHTRPPSISHSDKDIYPARGQSQYLGTGTVLCPLAFGLDFAVHFPCKFPFALLDLNFPTFLSPFFKFSHQNRILSNFYNSIHGGLNHRSVSTLVMEVSLASVVCEPLSWGSP